MIGEYIVKQQIGEGSFGVVLLAKHQTTGKKVAIKLTTQKEATKEYEILTKLHHPNIIHAIELIDVPITSRPKVEYDRGLVMDYIEGGDLIRYIGRGGRLPEKTAMKYLLQILVTKTHLVEADSPDIKPENVLIDEVTGNLILCDFGLATVCPLQKPLQGQEGSVLYCAPEVLRDLPYYGPQVDMWSAGVVFYCMLSGLVPWDGETLVEQASNAMSGHYETIHHISKDCSQILSSLLSVNPRSRPTAPQLIQTLIDLLSTDKDNDIASYLENPSQNSGEEDDLDEEDVSTEQSDYSPVPCGVGTAPGEPRNCHFRETSQSDIKHAIMYQLVNEETEKLLRFLEHTFEELHIGFVVAERTGWFRERCFKYKCKNGASKWSIEICIPKQTQQKTTKIILCHRIRGDHSHGMILLNQLYNKLHEL